MIPEEEGKIEKMEANLYSRKHSDDFVDERNPIAPHELSVDSEWKTGQENIREILMKKNMARGQEKETFFKKLLLGSFIFFTIAILIAAYMFFAGGNLVSSKNIDISVVAPTSIGGGEELTLEILVKNKNNADLESVHVLVEYPPGTREVEHPEEELLRQREELGKIAARSQARKTVKSILFGQKEEVKQIKITIEYRIKDSSAVFSKEKIFEIGIKSAPVTVSIQYPKEINSNQDMEFLVDIASNSPDPIKNLLLTAEYPFGFIFQSATPNPSSENNIWSIGNLATGEKRQIKIRGQLEGQNEEERTFRFYAGIENPKNEHAIGAMLSTLSESIQIKKPFIVLTTTLAGNSAREYVAKPGEQIQANIVWQSNVPVKLLNAKIEAKISGVALNREAVTTRGGGFYRSIDNTVIWDRSTNEEFLEIEPGEKGVVGFTLAPLDNLNLLSKNQQIDIVVSMTGSQILDDGIPQNVTATLERTVKLSSDVNLSSRIVRSAGPFENMGPIPPKADTETTYTVLWSITNPLNDVEEVKVRAALPAYVRWAGLVSPNTERITFDSVSKEVVWDAGVIRGGTGSTLAGRQIAFQIGFLPSLGQVGSAPVLVETATVTGKDQFTGRLIQFTQGSLNTRISTDSTFREGEEIVVK